MAPGNGDVISYLKEYGADCNVQGAVMHRRHLGNGHGSSLLLTALFSGQLSVLQPSFWWEPEEEESLIFLDVNKSGETNRNLLVDAQGLDGSD